MAKGKNKVSSGTVTVRNRPYGILLLLGLGKTDGLRKEVDRQNIQAQQSCRHKGKQRGAVPGTR